jgi:hypothetical protein
MPVLVTNALAITPGAPAATPPAMSAQLQYANPGQVRARLAPILALPSAEATAPGRTLYTHVVTLNPTGKMEDMPEARFRDGLPLVTFVDQFYALQKPLSDKGGVITSASTGAGAMHELERGFAVNSADEYLKQALSHILLGALAMEHGVYLLGKGGDAPDRHMAISIDRAATQFAESGAIFARMRYFHAAAMAYELAVYAADVLIAAGTITGDLRANLETRRTAWSALTAASWLQSLRSDDDTTTYSLRLAHALFAAYHAVNEKALHHKLLDRSYTLNTRGGQKEEATADSLRMAWTRLDLLYTFFPRAEIQKGDWQYVANMIERAVGVWEHSHLREDHVAHEARRLAAAARQFGGGPVG